MKYKIIILLTLLLPISSFLIISTITGKTYDAEVFKYEESSTIHFEQYDDGYVVYSEKASYNGYIVPYNEEYGIYIEESDIVKIDHDYFTVNESQFVNLDDIPPTVEQSNKWVISMASIVALGIVALIIGSKMDLLKKHPRVSAFVTLLVITLILLGIQQIVTDMLNVFIIATASWGAYCIEYLIYEGLISKESGEKAESSLLAELKKLGAKYNE